MLALLCEEASHTTVCLALEIILFVSGFKNTKYNSLKFFGGREIYDIDQENKIYLKFPLFVG